MSKIFSNIFGSNKNKSNKDKCDGQMNKNESKQNQENEEDLPPVVIPRRLSLSKSGRMKEKKRSKLSVLNIQRNESCLDGGTQKMEPSSQADSRESLDKTK